jgi:UrcA family protein
MLRTLAATAALLALTVSAAQAGTWPEESVHVAFGDLNLSKPDDAKTLADRLQAAATKVCLNTNGDATGHATLAAQNGMQACVDSAINVAMLRIEKSLTQHVRANLISNKQASLN